MHSPFKKSTIMMANLLNYIVWDPDPILAHLGPISIRYYATCWMVGLLLGYLMMHRLYKEQKLGEDKFEPLFIYLFVGILAGEFIRLPRRMKQAVMPDTIPILSSNVQPPTFVLRQ